MLYLHKETIIKKIQAMAGLIEGTHPFIPENIFV
jgi:hypothetical protein